VVRGKKDMINAFEARQLAGTYFGETWRPSKSLGKMLDFVDGEITEAARNHETEICLSKKKLYEVGGFDPDEYDERAHEEIIQLKHRLQDLGFLLENDDGYLGYHLFVSWKGGYL
jgi:hypothetical protein